MHDILRKTEHWFKQAVPVVQAKNVNVQTGCHLEEVTEMLQEMAPLTVEAKEYTEQAINSLNQLADYLKKSDGELKYLPTENVGMLDSLCDQIVTAVGVAHMLGYDIIGAMEEVNGSNFSKFVGGKPLFDENRKVKKGPAYYAPRLAPFVTRYNF